jgi:DNA-binding GntR family transcriptional regulator
MPISSKKPLSSRNGLGQQAYDRLLQSIQNGSLRPSDRVVEEDIALKWGISRTPVREALQRLEADGLLIHEPRKGLAIATLDHQMVVELYGIREVLEGAAAGFAAQHASPNEIRILKELCAIEPSLSADPAQGAKHNRRFHQTLCQIAHNRYLLKTLNSLTTSLALLGNYTRQIEGRAKQAVKEHAEIVAAIESRDAGAAEAAARAHIRAAMQARLSDISLLD